MQIISISSSSKKAGKTTLSTFLMRELPADYGLKVSADGHVPPIIDDPEIMSKPDTDTGGLVRAGAKKVIFASSQTTRGLGEVVRRSIGLFPADGLLIVEGNSALQHISPDFAIFIAAVPLAEFKPSAFLALPRANLVLIDMRWSLKDCDVDETVSELEKHAPNAQTLFYLDDGGMQEAFRESARLARASLSDNLVSRHYREQALRRMTGDS